MAALLLAFAIQLFTLEGRLAPASRAHVAIHAATNPFAVSTEAGPDGRFRFRKLAQGSYSLVVTVLDRGETRLTVSVGPGTADSKNRVRVRVPINADKLDYQSASTVSAEALSVPEKARRAYANAMRKIAQHDVQAATRDLEQAVRIAPKFAAAWNHLGTIAYQTKYFDQAEEYFRAALEADSSLYEPLVNLGGVLIVRQNYDEAWNVNVQAVALRPQDALAHSQLGITYLYLNKLELAEKHLLEAVSLDPAHFSHPQVHLAEVYLRRNEIEKARVQIEDFLRRHPDNSSASKMREALQKWRDQGR